MSRASSIYQMLLNFVYSTIIILYLVCVLNKPYAVCNEENDASVETNILDPTDSDVNFETATAAALTVPIEDSPNNRTASSDAISRQYPAGHPPPFAGSGCPLCDSSVYSYCSYKMIHDSCCCDFPAVHLRPPQCYYTDCSLLYAKSCYEHALIKNCCCNNPY